MDNDIYSKCKEFYKTLYIDTKLEALEKKIVTYIDIYNLTYTNIFQDSDDEGNGEGNGNGDGNGNSDTTNPIINYTTVKLERIGNVEKLYKNFTNNKKLIHKKLSYSLHKITILVILNTLHYIMISKGKPFNFDLYNYELYNVIGVDTIYVIQQKNKNLNFNYNENDKYTTESCIMLIFIRDKMFIHYY